MTDVEWIEIAGDANREIVVPIDIAGIKTMAVLDTGAAVTILDTRWAARVGVRPMAGARVTGHSRTTEAAWGTDIPIAFGGAAAVLRKVAILDLRTASLPGGTPIGVLIGLDVFAETMLDLDLPSRRVAVRRPTGKPSQGDFDRVPMLRGSRGERTIPISLEGRPAILANVDTGSSNPLMIDTRYAATTKLLDEKRTSTAAMAGVEGINLTTTASVDELSICGRRLSDVPIEVFERWYSAEVPANVGLPVLRRFRIMLDFPGNQAWIDSSSDAKTQPFQRDLSGLGIAVRSDRLEVVHVARGSPAAVAGWTAGETIVAVDGHAIDAAYPRSALSGWRYGPEGRSVGLTTIDGSVRFIGLARHY